MGYDLTRELLFLGVVAFLACTFIASREQNFGMAIVLSAIRVAIPVAYFAWYFDGTWTLQDDFAYFRQGQYLLDNGFTPLSALSQEGSDAMRGLAGGRHVLYIWWNFVMMWVFGVNYYAPVCINVVITFVAGHFFVLLLHEAGCSAKYRKLLHVFYLLHWETIAWSSFVNLKDSIVQTLTIALFFFSIRAVRRRRWQDIAAALIVSQLFYWVRFYIPVLVAGAGLVWVFLEWRDSRKYLLLGAAALGAMLVVPAYLHRLHQMSPTALAFGAAHYLLTPQPWSVLPSYSFLELPALCHWIAFLPAIGGAVVLWRESRVARLLIIYVAGLVLFYSIVDDLRGVRHRSQISFVFAWVQMHFVWRWSFGPSTSNQPSRSRTLLGRPISQFEPASPTR